MKSQRSPGIPVDIGIIVALPQTRDAYNAFNQTNASPINHAQQSDFLFETREEPDGLEASPQQDPVRQPVLELAKENALENPLSSTSAIPQGSTLNHEKPSCSQPRLNAHDSPSRLLEDLRLVYQIFDCPSELRL